MNPKTTEITKEKNFWDLYFAIRKVPNKLDNVIIYAISLLVLACINYSIGPVVDGAKVIHSRTTDIISWSTAILGFAIAGYSIFATLSDKELQLALSAVIEKKSNIDYLRVAHFNMLKTIIDIIIIIFIAYTIQNMSTILSKTDCGYMYFKTVSDSLFIAVLLSSKSFAFNVYSSIMMSLRWYAESKEDDSAPPDN